ncbi:MAG: DUF5915 domain-containing protein, partial [Candidatus ainarchaeum sp.]|nr:DUF5915 domain-containing protein [Candidatus ainarchaeum sp.]
KGENPEGALYAIYTSVFTALGMFAPVSPFIGEQTYQRFFRKYEEAESISLVELRMPRETEINTALEKRMAFASQIITCALEARQRTGIKLRWPVREVRVKTPSNEVKSAVEELSEVLKRMLNAKEAIAVEKDPEGDYEGQEFEGGKVFVSKKLEQELYEEGIYNDVKRRVQQLRKELALVEKDKIALEVDAEKEIEVIVRKYQDALAKETNAKSVSYSTLDEEKAKTFDIDGRKVKLRAKKD